MWFPGIEISLHQLNQVLRRQGLCRRKYDSDIREILNAIETELEGSGNSISYRQMHQRLRIDYRLVVQKETVRVRPLRLSSHFSWCSGTLSDYYVTYHVVSKTGQNRSRVEHRWSKDIEAKLFTVTVVC